MQFKRMRTDCKIIIIFMNLLTYGAGSVLFITGPIHLSHVPPPMKLWRASLILGGWGIPRENTKFTGYDMHKLLIPHFTFQ